MKLARPGPALWLILALTAAAAGGAALTYWLTKNTPSAPTERKILFYKNPMGSGHVSNKPMKDEMGMDYIPVYSDEAQTGMAAEGAVQIDPSMTQNIGVRTVVVKAGTVGEELSANGVLTQDETRTSTITAKVDGYIEKLHVGAVGQYIKQDQPLFDFYSPDLAANMEEYLAAIRYQEGAAADTPQSTQRNAAHLVFAAQKRLEALGLNREHFRKMRSENAVSRTVTFHSTQSGVLVKKNAVQGGRVTAGTELFSLADLSTLWVIAEVYALDSARLRAGQSAKITVQGLPGKVFNGKVDFVYPMLNDATRTVSVRITLNNAQQLLRPGMAAAVTLSSSVATRLLVPKSAVLRSGKRDTVILALGEGRFRPQIVTLGPESGDQYSVLGGVKAGDVVVSSAQFLIDSESRLNEALQKMTPTDAAPAGK